MPHHCSRRPPHSFQNHRLPHYSLKRAPSFPFISTMDSLHTLMVPPSEWNLYPGSSSVDREIREVIL
ncbi:uncharacterized protein G2W53_003683 [Senna tora]|uniref:Uncharacterized protein n=1 Tax=Senna tora TaxID=362788 RepID=A0A834XB34_9FABA|nr:uncharacterized protein G2W53_003683 [Senna tora]